MSSPMVRFYGRQRGKMQQGGADGGSMEGLHIGRSEDEIKERTDHTQGRYDEKDNEGQTARKSVASLDPYEMIDCRPPTRHTCGGCGTKLQYQFPDQPGYIAKKVLTTFHAAVRRTRLTPYGVPVEKGQLATTVEGWKSMVTVDEPDGKRIPKVTRVTKVLCRSCFRIQHYGSDAVGDNKTGRRPAKSIAEKAKSINLKYTLKSIESHLSARSVLIMLVDITDVECSFVPELLAFARLHDVPLVCAVNKIDCLDKLNIPPQYLKRWLLSYVRGLSQDVRPRGDSLCASDNRTDDYDADRPSRCKEVCFLSGRTGAGFRDLEASLESVVKRCGWRKIGTRGDDGHYSFIVVGRSNVGKSTVVNQFLKFVKHKLPHGASLDTRAKRGGSTASPYPFTTKGCIVYDLSKHSRLVDTPGVPITKAQMSSTGLTLDGLKTVVSPSRIFPNFFKVRMGLAVLIGEVCRIDVTSAPTGTSHCYLTAYVGRTVTGRVCQIDEVDGILVRNNYLKAAKSLRPAWQPHIPSDELSEGNNEEGDEKAADDELDLAHHIAAVNSHDVILSPQMPMKNDRPTDFISHVLTISSNGTRGAIEDISIGGLGWICVSLFDSDSVTLTVWVPTGVTVCRRPPMLPDITARRVKHSKIIHRLSAASQQQCIDICETLKDYSE